MSSTEIDYPAYLALKPRTICLHTQNRGLLLKKQSESSQSKFFSLQAGPFEKEGSFRSQ